eukprot:3456169-Rhodomonas_salina.14
MSGADEVYHATATRSKLVWERTSSSSTCILQVLYTPPLFYGTAFAKPLLSPMAQNSLLYYGNDIDYAAAVYSAMSSTNKGYGTTVYYAKSGTDLGYGATSRGNDPRLL